MCTRLSSGPVHNHHHHYHSQIDAPLCSLSGSLGIIHILRHQGIGGVGVGQNMTIDDSYKGGWGLKGI